MSLSPFITKPSDAMMACIFFCCCLLFLGILHWGARIAEATTPPEAADEAVYREAEEDDGESETDEETEESEDEEYPDTQQISLEPGCRFVARGYVLTVLLIALGMLLVWLFQLLHPGQ